jgi:hypothetical protein
VKVLAKFSQSSQNSVSKKISIVRSAVGRGDIIQLREAVPERFAFCGTLSCSAIFGGLEMDNRAFCNNWAGKEKHPKQKRD